jgi:hypothetical protein
MTAGSLGKIPTTRARRLISFVHPLKGIGGPDLDQWARGKAVKARTSAFASFINGSILGKVAASWSRTLSQVAATASVVG